MSQSLPNQVNDFNTNKKEVFMFFNQVSQSLPNQVNDFNFENLNIINNIVSNVAIPSKPGQRLQLLISSMKTFEE